MLNLKSEKDRFKEEFRQRIKRFVLALINFIESLPRDTTCKIISSQLLRSGTSIGANYFEARAASSKSDFTNFFSHSLKSANESRFWPETLVEAKKCSYQQASHLLNEFSEIANVSQQAFSR
ncbi:MAG: four helix bundle protein [Candidatus Omnitrophota bacterium]